jgi:hypothetical protein
MWRLSGAVALALLTAACSAADEPDASPPPGATTSAATTPSIPSEPAVTAPGGVELTTQGSDLAVGDHASVSWQPRADVVGVLDVRVTRLERAPIRALAAFGLDRSQRRSSLYYVHGKVENLGGTDLAGADVPLYVLDDRDRLVEATPVGATFGPCASAPLPSPFPTGERVSFCLLYLVPDHGGLDAVSFRPTQDFDPITWTGDVVRWSRKAR